MVIVKDHSSVGSSEAAQGFAAAYPVRRVTKVLNAENGGVAVGIRLGAAAAPEAAYVATLNDDYRYPEKLSDQLALFDAYPTLTLTCTAAAIRGATGRRAERLCSDQHGRSGAGDLAVVVRKKGHACALSLLVKWATPAEAAASMPATRGVWDHYRLLIAVATRGHECRLGCVAARSRDSHRAERRSLRWTWRHASGWSGIGTGFSGRRRRWFACAS